MTDADDRPLKPDLWDSDGNVLIPLHGIRIAMGLALGTAGAYWLFTFIAEREMHTTNPLQPSGFPDSFWVTILWVALPLMPFIASVVLLSTRSQGGIAAGAGIGAALFLCSLLFSIAALLGFLLTSGPIPYALPLAVSNLIFSASSVWVIVSAFRIAYKAGWGMFFLTLAAALVGMTLAYHALGGH